MIKLFASDMDGTLLDQNHELNQTNADAIKALQAHGIEFIISTGRDYQSARNFLANYNIDCAMINLNGAQIYDEKGQLLEQCPINNATTQQVFDYLHEKQLAHSLTTRDQYYLSNKQEYLNHMLQAHDEIDEVTLAQVTDKIMVTLDASDYQLSDDNPVFKMMVISDDAQALDKARIYLESFSDLDITSSGPGNLEITHIEAQKGLALAKYLARKHYSFEEVLTIGDSLNDRSMLAMCPNSYAMDNASDEVKAMAAYLAPSNVDNGVATIIHQLIEKQSEDA
ncbi:HAD family hydrolase [Tuanshanicoccus lijuaniae]|uniref:HAD family hydrolase n=1 Tax=Aerococcaceae bacterium zg-1292 TaxID=2774330 RepID=UPI001BD81694|nr:HAD family hydrolase [Aerococcaceae bacterium zg-A91]MBS4458554.1 HAD family hydrolase [Aerococcaceae bacterium zg-BR33]